ncbi:MULTISPECIES: heme o synthase [Bacillaceae]|uniref:Protoheme IX farnesyltransferase n=1 Tax=Evansella alkalicola TaxID=745819 RepID=A0ABS6JWM5_9BACI|nr:MULTISPECIES: heme o synthase [Bacillaceae]MBU9722994.1 heme o synthase [Bacillus alkalicola]
MQNEVIKNVQPTIKEHSVLEQIKYLIKAPVLIANVVPVLTGFLLALFFSGATFAGHLGLLLLTLIGSTLVIAGALVINNWYDVDIDTVMGRTKKRPTVTGDISLKTVLTIGIVLSGVGFIIMFFTTLEATLYSFIGWFTYVFLYTMWSKRRYTWNTIIGSVSGAVTPLIGWAALEPAFSHIVPLVLFMIIFIWQMPHTYSIAMRKYDEYKAAGVKMLPVVKGFRVTKIHFLFYVICLFPLPFFLMSLGMVFVITATILNIAWLILCIQGFMTKNNHRWATNSFFYSVNYLMILFVLMIVVTFPIFQ